MTTRHAFVLRRASRTKQGARKEFSQRHARATCRYASRHWRETRRQASGSGTKGTGDFVPNYGGPCSRRHNLGRNPPSLLSQTGMRAHNGGNKPTRKRGCHERGAHAADRGRPPDHRAGPWDRYLQGQARAAGDLLRAQPGLPPVCHRAVQAAGGHRTALRRARLSRASRRRLGVRLQSTRAPHVQRENRHIPDQKPQGQRTSARGLHQPQHARRHQAVVHLVHSQPRERAQKPRQGPVQIAAGGDRAPAAAARRGVRGGSRLRGLPRLAGAGGRDRGADGGRTRLHRPRMDA